MLERFKSSVSGAFVCCLLSLALAPALRADTSEIKVDLKLDGADFVSGERVRGVVSIVNASPDRVGIGTHESRTNGVAVGKFTMKDRFFIEVYRASDMKQLDRVNRRPFVADFYLKTSEGQKLEAFLGDHYDLREPSRYLAKPVFVHNGTRYEGMIRAFDVVEGVKVASAMQMFKNRPGLERNFALVYWSRNHSEHLFLTAGDSGLSKRKWETRDLGPILRIDKPSISILGTGEVIVLHRLNQDQFVRSEFWSVPDKFHFHLRETVGDPETAGTARVRELYKEGGVKPKQNPWWKFW